MISHRIGLVLMAAILIVLVVLFTPLKKTTSPSEIGLQVSGVTTNRDVLANRPLQSLSTKSPLISTSLTPAEIEVNRLEGEFYDQFPLALKYRDYQKDRKNAENQALSERYTAYLAEPPDVRTRNLWTGNLNVILEMEAALLFKQMLISEPESDLGEMLRVSWNAPRWDWGHTLRYLDERLNSHVEAEEVTTPEQLVTAFQMREERMLEYCRKLQNQASMPDSIREDIRQTALDIATAGVVGAYLETITPPSLEIARKRVADEQRSR